MIRKEALANVYQKEIEELDPRMHELLGNVEMLELKVNWTFLFWYKLQTYFQLAEKREEKERIVEKLRAAEEENVALLTSYNYLSSTVISSSNNFTN